jgi:hypothetical protein
MRERQLCFVLGKKSLQSGQRVRPSQQAPVLQSSELKGDLEGQKEKIASFLLMGFLW